MGLEKSGKNGEECLKKHIEEHTTQELPDLHLQDKQTTDKEIALDRKKCAFFRDMWTEVQGF